MANEKKRKLVQHRSTSRVLDIFELICSNLDDTDGLTLTDISQALSVPKGSLSPIMRTLLARGYLSVDPQTLRYTVGAMLFSKGYTYISKGGLNRDIQPIMEDVVRKVSETCHLAELNGGQVFYLLKVDSPEAIRMYSSPGRLLPAYSTSLGKALLSGMSKEDLIKLYPEGLKPVTPQTVTDMDVLIEQLREVGKTGYAFEIEESTPFVRCVGIPILSRSIIRYALSVATPLFRYSQEKEKRICEALAEAKMKIEAIL